MSLGQFVLTHRNAQVGERCQTTEREGAGDRFVGRGVGDMRLETCRESNLYINCNIV